jgi:hypothetical protein
MAKITWRTFPATDVWAAASFALSEPSAVDRDVYAIRVRMAELVQNTGEIPQEHRTKSQEMVSYFQGLVFRMLSGDNVDPWLTSVFTQAQATEISEMHWGLIVSAVRSYPDMARRDAQRQQEQFLMASSQCVGGIGEKLKLNLEVIRSVYSEKWSVYYVTAVISGSSNLVFFSYKQGLDSGQRLSVQGTVREHIQNSKDGNRTRLNRVRSLDTVAETA